MKFKSKLQIGVGKLIEGKQIIGYGDGSGLIEWLWQEENVFLEEDNISLNKNNLNLFPYHTATMIYLRGLTKIEVLKRPLFTITLIDNETFNYQEIVKIENFPKIFYPSILLDKLKEFGFEKLKR